MYIEYRQDNGWVVALAPDGAVVLERRSSAPSQQWEASGARDVTFYRLSTIAKPNLFVTLPNLERGQLVLEPATTPRPEQEWTFTGAGCIRSRLTGVVAHVGPIQSTLAIVTYPENDSTEQTFVLRRAPGAGEGVWNVSLYNPYSMVVDATASNTLVLAPLQGVATQQWSAAPVSVVRCHRIRHPASGRVLAAPFAPGAATRIVAVAEQSTAAEDQLWYPVDGSGHLRNMRSGFVLSLSAAPALAAPVFSSPQLAASGPLQEWSWSAPAITQPNRLTAVAARA